VGFCELTCAPRDASGSRRSLSIEVAELIVQTRVEGRIGGRSGFGWLGPRLTPRPPEGRQADDERAGAGQGIREQPGETVESAVDRLRHELLAAVDRHEMRDDLIAVLSLSHLIAE